MSRAELATLKKHVNDIHVRYPDLTIDNAFVLWFMSSYLVEDEKAAKDCLVGGPSDWGVDAIFIDNTNRKVFLVQAKYRTNQSVTLESRSDLRAFGQLANALHGDGSVLRNMLENVDEKISDRATNAHRLLKKSGFSLHLYFVTTGRVSLGLENEAREIVENAPGPAELTIFNRRQVLSHLDDWLIDAAPSVPFLDLEIEPGSGIITRSDPKTNADSWVFSMKGTDVGALYAAVGVRLFARNIRGFLGRDTDVNIAIRDTLQRCPENFWYYNNGVTLVCDSAGRADQGMREVLRVCNPQIINGQQTTRMLREFGSKKASLLVRVIAVPRSQDGGESKFEELVGDIVQATNWQNEIKGSDLRSNDFEQVRIQRELRRLDYEYLRKRQAKGEIKRLFGISRAFQITKEELAKAVAACEFDPARIREGTERLFQEDIYSRIFNGRPAKTYLAIAHLDRIVRAGSRHRPEWGYARWIVLNHAWQNLEPEIGHEPERSKFIYICERHRPLGLESYVSATYRAALRFFREKRGRGEQALDASGFFRHKDLDDRFQKFWASSSNPTRGKARTAFLKFSKALREFEVE
jgi:hypothetical protein